MKRIFYSVSALMLLAGAAACKKNDNNDNPGPKGAELKTQSVTPSLVYAMPGFETVEVLPLISSEDKLPESPDFIYGAQPDGAGLLKNPSGPGYVMLTNHEILFSVSRVTLDDNFKPLKGEYIVDRQGGGMRLCSATLGTPEEHGFGPVFLTAGESSEESLVHAISPVKQSS
jgi:hypothetical protein